MRNAREDEMTREIQIPVFVVVIAGVLVVAALFWTQFTKIENEGLTSVNAKLEGEAGTWEADYQECQNWMARSRYMIMSQELFNPDGLQCVWVKPGAQAWIDPLKAYGDTHSWAPDHPSRGQDVLPMYGILNFAYDEKMVAVVTSELADDQFYSDGFYTLLWYSIDDVELAETCPPNWPER